MKPSADNCSKCGEQHPPRKGKAYGKECFKCKKITDDTLKQVQSVPVDHQGTNADSSVLSTDDVTHNLSSQPEVVV